MSSRSALGRGTLLLTLLVLLIGCTTSDRRTADPKDLPGGSAGTVDNIEPGFDPAEQVAIANDLRDQLVVAGIACSGEAHPAERSSGGFDIGLAAALDCTVSDAKVEIGIYRSRSAKKAGLGKLNWLACTAGGTVEYVAGDVWTVGAIANGTNDSDPELTREIGQALDAPVKGFTC